MGTVIGRNFDRRCGTGTSHHGIPIHRSLLLAIHTQVVLDTWHGGTIFINYGKHIVRVDKHLGSGVLGKIGHILRLQHIDMAAYRTDTVSAKHGQYVVQTIMGKNPDPVALSYTQSP